MHNTIHNGLLNCKSFVISYRELLKALLTTSVTEVNRRTGELTHTLLGGVSFRLTLTDGKLPVPGVRRMRPATAAAEIAWYVLGTQNITWLQKYTRIWDKFTEDDKLTVENAYGYRWREYFGRDQLEDAIQTLKNDRSTRQAVVCAWDPREDGLGRQAKNFPCPTHFTFSITDNLLHSSLFLRSSDVFVGLPYDVMGHAFLIAMVAKELGIVPGIMHVTLSHAHLYIAHHNMAVEAIERELNFSTMPLPEYTLTEVAENPDAYVESVKISEQDVKWPSYDPKPGLII